MTKPTKLCHKIERQRVEGGRGEETAYRRAATALGQSDSAPARSVLEDATCAAEVLPWRVRAAYERSIVSLHPFRDQA